MVDVSFDPLFKKRFSKTKNRALKKKIIKQFSKIRENPMIGKPMRYTRKGTREVYIQPFRLSYMYIEEEDKILFIDLYHKDKQ